MRVFCGADFWWDAWAYAIGIPIADNPLSTKQSSAQRRASTEDGKDRASTDRREAIALMLRDGRIDEARLHARTADEGAIVNAFTTAKAKPRMSGTAVCSTSGYALSGCDSGSTVCRGGGGSEPFPLTPAEFARFRAAELAL